MFSKICTIWNNATPQEESYILNGRMGGKSEEADAREEECCLTARMHLHEHIKSACTAALLRTSFDIWSFF